jgi:16S rRNA (guanine1207-N2)-methyltransferase
MAQHYFAERPSSRERRAQLQATLRGREYHFLTAGGVFSRSRIDPGTRLLIESMQVAEADWVLDLGCGYGAVGLVAAHLAPRGKVFLVDINARAVELAAENVALNAVENAEVRPGSGTASLGGVAFDVVLCNPPLRAGKQVVQELFRQAQQSLKPGGKLYFVARTQQGAKTLARAAGALFSAVEEVAKASGYRVYLAHKARPEEERLKP